MKATIIYPHDATFQIEIGAHTFIHNALAECWEKTNPDSDPENPNHPITALNAKGAKLRSSMVGDIYVVDGRYFFVNCTGFVQVSEVQAIKIQRVETDKRLFGWDCMIAKHPNIGEPIQIL